MAASSGDFASLLQRHATDDWGDLEDTDMKANRDTVAYGARIFGSYKLDQDRVGVITAADHSPTCLLLASEY